MKETQRPIRLSSFSFYLASLVSVPLFFYVDSLDVFNVPKVVLFLSLSLGMVVMFSLERQPREPSNGKSDRLLMSLFVILILGLIFSAIVTNSSQTRILWGYPGRANGLLYYIPLLIVAYLSSQMRFNSKLESRLLIALTTVFGLEVIYAGIQYANLDPFKWDNPYNRILGTLGNPNFASSMLGIAGSYFFFQSLHSKRKSKYLYLSAAIFSATYSYLAQSIQGPIIFVIGLALGVFCEFGSRLKEKQKITLIGSSAVLSVLLFVSFLGLGPLGSYLYQYTFSLRIQYWLIGIKTAFANPMTGIGPDSYVEGFRLFRGQDFVQKYTSNLLSDSAHNVIINFAANFGIMNAILLLAIISLISKRALTNLIKSNSSTQNQKILSILWVLYLLQSLISIEQVGLSVPQWLIGGLLLNKEFAGATSSVKTFFDSKKGSVSTQKRNLLSEFRGEISILVVLISFWTSSSVLREEARLRNLQKDFPQISQTDPVVQELESKFSNYTFGEFRRLNWILNFYVDRNLVEQTQALVSNYILLNEDDVEAIDQLARIKGFKGEFYEEIRLRELIAKKDPSNYRNLLMLADSYGFVGNRVEAKKTAIKAKTLAPKESLESESATVIINRG